MSFETVIGIGIHLELKQNKDVLTCSKMFGARPNSNVNVIDMAFPGTMPVLNKKR